MSESSSPTFNSSCTQEVTKHRRSRAGRVAGMAEQRMADLETTLLGSGSFAQACQVAEDKLKAFADRTEVRLGEARTKYRITPME